MHRPSFGKWKVREELLGEACLRAKPHALLLAGQPSAVRLGPSSVAQDSILLYSNPVAGAVHWAGGQMAPGRMEFGNTADCPPTQDALSQARLGRYGQPTGSCPLSRPSVPDCAGTSLGRARCGQLFLAGGCRPQGHQAACPKQRRPARQPPVQPLHQAQAASWIEGRSAVTA